jgi:hypothetical protein
MNENSDQKKLTYISFSRIYDFNESGVLFVGTAVGTRVEMTFEGRDLVEIERSFHESVQNFLQMAGAKDAQTLETGPENDSSKQKEAETLIAVHLPDEIIRQVNAYKKFRTIEDHIVQLVVQDIKENQREAEVWRAFEEWRPSKLIEVIPLENFSLKVRFDDGTAGEYDMKPSIQRGGVFFALSDLAFFQKVSIGGMGNFIFWPDEIEIGADTIYEKVMKDCDAKWLAEM